MKLTELRPRWITPANWHGPFLAYGIEFDCPTCGHRLAVHFLPWINPDRLPTEGDFAYGQLKWQRTGDTFETLSLQPSIDFGAAGCWHGHITNGELTTAVPHGPRKPAAIDSAMKETK